MRDVDRREEEFRRVLRGEPALHRVAMVGRPVLDPISLARCGLVGRPSHRCRNRA
ncbi:hypothetical protein N136_04733 [Leifsonia aquatica ATCC 14665]|uniref:Uncharacterized protein n=1 Tax=Leifsonia aquatica ATCC 14665 TaxID=1358026 RepID=U2RCE0_LEIAQ|nr:hypothetical protein N136_04733 [Leifsonia aquatica ATCC 14665]